RAAPGRRRRRAHRGQGDGRGDPHAARRRAARRLRAPADHRYDHALCDRDADARLLARLLLPAATRGRGMSAEANARLRGAQKSKTRQFITPEGVDLELRIASSGLRFGALIIDLAIMLLLLIVFTLLILW